jgi:hypothetical protein
MTMRYSFPEAIEFSSIQFLTKSNFSLHLAILEIFSEIAFEPQDLLFIQSTNFRSNTLFLVEIKPGLSHFLGSSAISEPILENPGLKDHKPSKKAISAVEFIGTILAEFFNA